MSAHHASSVSRPESLGEILDRFEVLAESDDRVAVGDMVDVIGTRSYGPFLIVPAMIELSPLGGVPGVPTALAAVVVLFALQMLWGRKRLWVPGFVARRALGARQLQRVVAMARPLAARLDQWFYGRLQALAVGTWIRIAAAACVALALLVPPLELFPFASSVPMGAIALFGLALMVRDGALMVVASVLACGAVALMLALVL
ncbi:MAG: exopolysaccharide biosynthesis protein [Acidovorax sp.]|nr:exopolysaccharide biosynthesis protein [Acidovorax sp.]